MCKCSEILDEMMEERTPYKEDMPLHKTLWYELCHWWYIALEEAKSRIQALWDGWIPVTERLPEEWCYLAFSDGIMYVTATWNDSIFWNAWEIVSWVTHWMNLPNPPKQ